MKEKIVIVRLHENAISDYDGLCSRNDKQSKIILRALERIKVRLKQNPQFGDPIKKKLFPDKYNTYGNLYRIELPNFWRLIYTLEGNQIRIVVFVLDIKNHKDYNKLFGYK